ncbi:glycosyltransferase family 39 protein [Actinosynnema pretiosum subsp. pretiosum]|uniref:Glycosyltransferase family 39 protein n=1 Tax=Actinosynnema pretiosum subsp. pretiosum TaxID=103721 RepID=A0AA45LAY6_9PSEU|nr:Dolichyl-phosphate-mannose-protein mannosyltransferase family [Actinosynnema pretiosum subsp. pretiosum]QUF06447.1 glycosyltransferase family 39 protein [Actinosynnema pretiosum subsp. pretiosum]
MTALLTEPPATPAAETPARGRLARLVLGPADAPRYARPALLLLLAATAALYLWDLTASGYGNSFYAAAVQAGTQDWKAWLFGSLDSGNAITVDKPPAALWLTTAFARVFGFSSFTVLAPQALMGVAAVALTHATVKRTSGHLAGLLAGAALAVTPVAVLMFRFNNPDALLVLLMVAGAYCLVRALERASLKWVLLAGSAIGFAFLTKMLQGFLVLPAFALVYLVAAPTSLGRRVAHLFAALGAVVVSAGWFIALVDLWPSDSRPYIGGSTDNTLLELALGYNGLGRILGGQGNGGGGGGMGGGNTGFGGETGISRMFGAAFGGEISWLLPAALVALVAGLWFTRRAPRTDRTRAALLLWGGWLIVTAVVFSFMSGTVHPYYSVALAPAIAALVAIGGRELWRARKFATARAFLAAMVGVTAVWDHVLLARSSDYAPVIRYAVLVVGFVVVLVVLLDPRRVAKGAVALAAAAVLVVGVGGGAWAVSTAGQAHTGSIPSSGPAGSSMGFGGGGGGGGGGQMPGGDGQAQAGQAQDGQAQDGQMQDGGMRGGPGGGTSSEVVELLKSATSKWAAATTGSQSAAELELSTGKAVIAIGGWSGSDNAPTLEQFQRAVANGEISYYISGGGMGGGMGGRGGSESSTSAIATWVQENYTAQTVGGSTLYDLR